MKLITVRHGETEWNLQEREMGQLDSALTSRGIQQAECLARRLSHISFSALYSSDLGRAHRTAQIIASACDKRILVDAGLRERHMGIFQGLTLDEREHKFPQERADYQRLGVEYVIPGGESARQRLERSVRVLTDIAEHHVNESVVAVTHGGFLMGFFEFVLGMTPGNGWRFARSNAGYSVFRYLQGKWRLETWNDMGHLDGIS